MKCKVVVKTWPTLLNEAIFLYFLFPGPSSSFVHIYLLLHNSAHAKYIFKTHFSNCGMM